MLVKVATKASTRGSVEPLEEFMPIESQIATVGLAPEQAAPASALAAWGVSPNNFELWTQFLGPLMSQAE